MSKTLKEMSDYLKGMDAKYAAGDKTCNLYGKNDYYDTLKMLRKGRRQVYRESIDRNLPWKPFQAHGLWHKSVAIPGGSSYLGIKNDDPYAKRYDFEFPCGYHFEARTLEEAIVAAIDWVCDRPYTSLIYDVSISDGKIIHNGLFLDVFDISDIENQETDEPISKKWGAGGTTWMYNPPTRFFRDNEIP